MSLEDLLSTVQPFGSSGSRKRSVGPRSAKYRVAARRLGGKFTPEGRQMLMKGEQLRLMEPNISTPESRNLINRGEQIKAAYASGGLKFAKDLKPLRRQWFQDVQAANLSAEDKEGIRQMFSQDFLDAGKELDAEAQRDFNLKNQKFGIQKARQDIQRNQQIIKLGETTLRDAEDAQIKKGLQLSNEAIVSDFIGTQLKDIANAQQQSSELSQEEQDVKGIQTRQKIENKVTQFLADNPELSQGSTTAIENLLQNVGSDIRIAQQRQDRAEASRQAITNMMINQGLSIGFKPNLNLKGVEGLTTNLDNFAKAQKTRIDNLQAVKDKEAREAAIDEVASTYMATLTDLPKKSTDAPRTQTVADLDLKSYLTRVRAFAEFVPPSELKEIISDIEDLESDIDGDDWRGANDGVKGGEYIKLIGEIKGLMAKINASIYKPRTRVGLTKTEKAARNETTELLSRFKNKKEKPEEEPQGEE